MPGDDGPPADASTRRSDAPLKRSGVPPGPPGVFEAECRDYDVDGIERLLREGLEWLGARLPAGKLVVVKPNVLGAYAPEQHVTTHPAVLEALVRILRDGANRIVIADSSGNGQHGHTARALQVSGVREVAERYGIQAVSLDSQPDPAAQAFPISSVIREADWIVNVPKMKSHQLMRYTGAVKNLFGCMPGATKLRCHLDNPDPARFANWLLILYRALAPKILLNVMDGIVGLEGPGPGPAGRAKKTGLLAASQDALALDFAVTQFLGVRSRDIPTTRLAMDQGLFLGDVALNQALKPVAFALPNPLPIAGLLHRVFPRFAMSRPYAVPETCRLCGACARACPRGAVAVHDSVRFDYSRCIFCYCCHENCPQAAIALRQHPFLRLFNALGP